LLLRDLITPFTLEELLAQRGTLSGRLTTEAAPRMATFGVTLLAAEFKDLTVAAEIRTILSQIVRARQEGLAALERARGETAALRGLANAARLMEQHPALLHLRTLQAVSESVGNTFVLGMPPQHALAGKSLPPTEPEAE
jgi:regulator of protease activity HflC (stomatin/prohibitin superfamily)